MKRRFVQINGELVEVGPDYVPELRQNAPAILPDIAPYQSMIDGTMITSRSHHREHLRAHGCVEVGNDSSLNVVGKPRPPLQSPPGLKETIARQVYSKLSYSRSR